MELNWLECLIYGLISGFAEFFPISAEGHKTLFLLCLGAPEDPAGLRLVARLGCLAAVVFSCLTLLVRIRREVRLSRIPKKRRKRPLDVRIMGMRRLLTVCAVTFTLGAFAMRFLPNFGNKLLITAIVLAANGVILYLPLHMPLGNKDGGVLTGADGMLIGLGSVASLLPGFSRVGGTISVGLMRGASRQHMLDVALLLSIPALALLSVFDGIELVSATAQAQSSGILGSVLCFLAAFGGSCCSILAMRFMAVKIGFSSFAYYSWGLALLLFSLYLIV